MATAIGVLDAVRDSGQVSPEQFSQVFGSISFFVNAGIRFVEEICKLRAMTEMWEQIGRERYGVTDDKALRFRYGVQVNSLGLTEAQPENNVQRIVLEMLAVTLSKRARARSVQLPAWNEALGLPTPVGPAVVAADAAGARLRDRPARVRRHLRRLARDRGAHDRAARRGPGRTRRRARTGRRLRGGRDVEVTARRFDGDAHAPDRVGRAAGRRRQRLHRDRPSRRSAARARSSRSTTPSRPRWSPTCQAWRSARDQAAVDAALDELRRAAVEGDNVMPPSIALAKAGGTTGEWGRADARGVRRVPRPDGRVGRDGLVGRARRGGRVRQVDGRRAAEVPRRQARPRRPLQRRRADRRRRPRLRHGGRVLRHPADARADRRVGARRGSRRDRPVDPVGLAPRPGARRARST